MLVRTPFNKRLHEHMKRYCRVVAERSEEVVYTAISDVKVDAADLAMTSREFSRFVKKIVVDGGRKTRIGTVLFFRPERGRRLCIKLSDEEYNLLREYADEQGQKPSTAFREILDKILLRAWVRT